MYRHTKITHDLLFGDVKKYAKHRENATKEIQIGMKIQCNKDVGIVINILPKYIIYKIENRVKGCKFNEYEIIDAKYKPYQNHINKLKEKLKIGLYVKFNKYYGPIIKIKENKIYFKDENTSGIIWCLIDFVEIY